MIIHKTVRVARPPDIALKIFVEEMGRWWPNEKYMFNLGPPSGTGDGLIPAVSRWRGDVRRCRQRQAHDVQVRKRVDGGTVIRMPLEVVVTGSLLRRSPTLADRFER